MQSHEVSISEERPGKSVYCTTMTALNVQAPLLTNFTLKQTDLRSSVNFARATTVSSPSCKVTSIVRPLSCGLYSERVVKMSG